MRPSLVSFAHYSKEGLTEAIEVHFVDEIIPGVTVLHLKFGQGKIVSVEGPKDNKVATIHFKDDELAERRIVLKFARLQVL